jgi:2-(1,2-epoxy-1,2-dihydrophenyl)acetyl-CoA isomerase
LARGLRYIWRMSYENIQFDIQGGIARLALNRPHAANALDMAMGRELMDAVTRCDSDDSVRAVLLSAHGKMFSGGGDLASFSEFGNDVLRALKELTGYLHVAVSRLMRMRAPVVVAVNGVAAGGGMSLALAGDYVLAAESARFTMAYTKAGLVPDCGASHVLPRIVGLRRTQELIFTNRVLNAREAEAWGLVTRVVPDAELMVEAEKIVKQLAEGPTAAYGGVKRLLASTQSTSLETQLELESREIANASLTEDGKEGLAAFLGKRAPKFTGR